MCYEDEAFMVMMIIKPAREPTPNATQGTHKSPTALLDWFNLVLMVDKYRNQELD